MDSIEDTINISQWLDSLSQGRKDHSMKAVVMDKIGEPLKIKNCSIPIPRRNQVLIKVEATPVSSIDLNLLRHKPFTTDSPFQVGYEGSGTVIASGSGISSQILKGERVAFFNPSGRVNAWAEYALVPAQYCFELHKNVSFEIGASGVIAPFTAIAAIRTIKKEGHKAVVQTDAASEVGRMLIKLLNEEGITNINIVRSSEQRQIVEQAGGEIVLDIGEEDFEAKLSKIAYNLEATCLLEQNLDVLPKTILGSLPEGSVCYVYEDFDEEKHNQIDLMDVYMNNKSIKKLYFWSWFHEQSWFTRLSVVSQVRNLLRALPKSQVAKEFHIDEVNEAIKYHAEHPYDGVVLLKPHLDYGRA